MRFFLTSSNLCIKIPFLVESEEEIGDRIRINSY